MHQRPSITSDHGHIYIILMHECFSVHVLSRQSQCFLEQNAHWRPQFHHNISFCDGPRAGRRPAGARFKTEPLSPLHQGPLLGPLRIGAQEALSTL